MDGVKSLPTVSAPRHILHGCIIPALNALHPMHALTWRSAAALSVGGPRSSTWTLGEEVLVPQELLLVNTSPEEPRIQRHRRQHWTLQS